MACEGGLCIWEVWLIIGGCCCVVVDGGEIVIVCIFVVSICFLKRIYCAYFIYTVSSKFIQE